MIKKYLFWILLIFPLAANAKNDLPLVLYSVGWIVLFFVPIVMVEAIVLVRQSAFTVLNASLSAFIANACSTLICFAITLPIGALSVAIARGSYSDFMTLLILYPMYRFSIFIEHWVISIKKKDEQLKGSIVTANRISYLLIVAFLVTSLIKNLIIYGEIV